MNPGIAGLLRRPGAREMNRDLVCRFSFAFLLAAFSLFPWEMKKCRVRRGRLGKARLLQGWNRRKRLRRALMRYVKLNGISGLGSGPGGGGHRGGGGPTGDPQRRCGGKKTAHKTKIIRVLGGSSGSRRKGDSRKKRSDEEKATPTAQEMVPARS